MRNKAISSETFNLPVGVAENNDAMNIAAEEDQSVDGMDFEDYGDNYVSRSEAKEHYVDANEAKAMKRGVTILNAIRLGKSLLQ